MTISEKEALLQYLEFGLITLCDDIDPHMDPDCKGVLYESAYLLLIDMQDTLDMHVACQNP